MKSKDSSVAVKEKASSKRFEVIVKANQALKDIRGQKLQPTPPVPTITVISAGNRKKA